MWSGAFSVSWRVAKFMGLELCMIKMKGLTTVRWKHRNQLLEVDKSID